MRTNVAPPQALYQKEHPLSPRFRFRFRISPHHPEKTYSQVFLLVEGVGLGDSGLGYGVPGLGSRV